LTVKEKMLQEIKCDILKKRSDLSNTKVNLLAEFIYEIVFLRNMEGVEAQDIMIYIILRKAILEYGDDLVFTDNKFDISLQFIHDMIIKYSGGL